MLRVHFYAKVLFGLALLAGAPYLRAESPKAFDAAEAFGARPNVTALRLSPDGQSVAFVSPTQGQASVVYTLSLAPGAKARIALYADGKPFRMRGCNWVANDRLVCTVYALTPDRGLHGLLPVTRLIAVNADGSNPQQLSAKLDQHSHGNLGELLQDAAIIDWLPDQDGSVLVARRYVPDDYSGSHVGSAAEGLGVDLLDTRTQAAKHVIAPDANAIGYISDGRGTVRIVVQRSTLPGGLDRGVITYLYRKPGSNAWHTLSSYDEIDGTGFRPIAVDHDLNVAYGWKKLDGRIALYTMSLDDSPQEKLVYSRPDVDLGSLIRIGRRNRVVGVSYSTDVQGSEYFQDDIRQMLTALHKALPNQLISVVDSNVDESKMLIFAGSDIDPGVYYLFDRPTHTLNTFLVARSPLEGVTLAHVKPIAYRAADGQSVPGYLTLPPGVDNPRGLPAIVMPHGGPSSRDEWGFNWLAQFYAARGYVVLQPNFRGSAGFGDAWFEHNGFKSWEIAVGDVVAAGRWLVSEGIADPAKLGIVGWSYGGYAALQSVAVDPQVFKAIIAIAPVTDLAALKEERRHWSDFEVTAEFIGDGPHMRDGSPLTHARQFKQPVLMFHGTLDRNVSFDESRRMQAALKAAGAQSELVTYEDRDHQLDDSGVRTDMLRKSDAFLRHAFGMGP
ncbi:MAG TPA: S9 family peptidase [Steroidobacteraceae bacterium]